jgi:hydrogenase maturation protease
LNTWDENQQRDFLADMHYATPARALILAKALGVLPRKVYIIGCQPADANELGIGLSKAVERAAHATIAKVQKLVQELESDQAATQK